MRAFLEQYGISIFVIIIIGIMVLMGSGVGNTIEDLVEKEIKQFESVAKVETDNAFTKTDKNSGSYSLDWLESDMYELTDVLVNYTDENSDEFYNNILDTQKDCDITYHKISNELLSDTDAIYVKHLLKNNTEVEALLVNRDGGYVYIGPDGEQTQYYLLNLKENLTIPFDASENPVYITLTKGVWLIDLWEHVLDSTESLKITKAEFQYETATINGIEYIKMNDKTATKEDLIGKTAAFTASLNGEAINESLEITEDVILESENNLSLFEGLMVITPNGSYIMSEFVMAYDDVSGKIE